MNRSNPTGGFSLQNLNGPAGAVLAIFLIALILNVGIVLAFRGHVQL